MEPALELSAAQPVLLDDLPLIIGDGDLKYTLGQINGDGFGMHDGRLGANSRSRIPRRRARPFGTRQSGESIPSAKPTVKKPPREHFIALSLHPQLSRIGAAPMGFAVVCQIAFSYLIVVTKNSDMRRLLSLFLFLGFASISASAQAGPVDRSELDHKTWSGVVRCMQCDPRDAIERGMRITGNEPAFPADFNCRGIDEGWAIDYSSKRARDALHGGIDIPAPRGTPILAVADGTVVAMFDNHETAVGVRIFLQHSPEQTGKPFWVYSEYAHLQELPALQIGSPVSRGDVIGLTSNTGISGQAARAKAGGASAGSGKSRRDALHFAVMYSEGPDYAVLQKSGGHLVPVRAKWMDPVAFFRGTPPYDSDAVAGLAESEKQVRIPFRTSSGEVHPAESKLIWPYACTPR